MVVLHNRFSQALSRCDGRVIWNPACNTRAKFGGVALNPFGNLQVQITLVDTHESWNTKVPG